MAQCQRIIDTAAGERRCARDATRHIGDMDICWQHFDAIERSLVMPLIVERAELLAAVDTLSAQIPPETPVPDPDPRPWTVYIARMPHISPEHPRYGMVKIGRTRNLAQRMESLNLDAVLSFDERPAAFEYELHGRFAHLRADGEWFRMAPELAALWEAA